MGFQVLVQTPDGTAVEFLSNISHARAHAFAVDLSAGVAWAPESPFGEYTITPTVGPLVEVFLTGYNGVALSVHATCQVLKGLRLIQADLDAHGIGSLDDEFAALVDLFEFACTFAVGHCGFLAFD